MQLIQHTWIYNNITTSYDHFIRANEDAAKKDIKVS